MHKISSYIFKYSKLNNNNNNNIIFIFQWKVIFFYILWEILYFQTWLWKLRIKLTHTPDALYNVESCVSL